MKTLQIKLVVLAVLAVLALPAVAYGASSDEGYGGPNNVVSGIEGDSSPTPASDEGEEDSGSEVASVSDSDDSDVLPFTGTDLAIMAAAGLALVGFGYGLRRFTRHPSP